MIYSINCYWSLWEQLGYFCHLINLFFYVWINSKFIFFVLEEWPPYHYIAWQWLFCIIFSVSRFFFQPVDSVLSINYSRRLFFYCIIGYFFSVLYVLFYSSEIPLCACWVFSVWQFGYVYHLCQTILPALTVNTPHCLIYSQIYSQILPF